MRNISTPSKAALEGREGRSLPSYHQRKLQIWPHISDAVHSDGPVLRFTSYEEMVRIWQSTKGQMNVPQRHPQDVMDKGPGETTEKAFIQRCADFFAYEWMVSLAEGA